MCNRVSERSRLGRGVRIGGILTSKGYQSNKLHDGDFEDVHKEDRRSRRVVSLK